MIRWITLIASICFIVDARAAVTFPLDGYARVGRYMPVQVSGQRRVDGVGIVPVTCRDGFANDALVPMLVTSEPARINDAELHVLGDDQRLVALAGTATQADAERLFPNAKVVALNVAYPLRRPAIAWEALDAIILRDVDSPDAATTSALLSAGVVIAATTRSPDWPWHKRDDGLWLLDYQPIGPKTNAFDASSLLAAWWPGIATTQRRNVVVFAVIFAILALASSLRRGKAAMYTLAIVCIGSAIAIGFWSNAQPAMLAARGAVSMVDNGILQADWWHLQAATRSTTLAAKFPEWTRPLASADELAASKMTLECDRTGRPQCFRWNVTAGSKYVFLARAVDPSPGGSIENARHNSPLRAIVPQAYPGTIIVGEGPSTAADAWPYICIVRAAK